MCGIQVLVALSESLPTPKDVSTTGTDVDTCSEVWARLTAANSRRGPDAHSEKISLYPLACVKLGAHVLHLRGPHTQTQPIIAKDTGDMLCWNGEIFDGLDIGNNNDGAVLLENIQQIKLQHPTDYILRMFSNIEGPYAFVYLDHAQQKLWFARDYLGRRSLLTKTINNRTLLLSSVADVGCNVSNDSSGWFELPAQRIYCLDLANLHQTEHEMFPLGPVVEYKWHYSNLDSSTYSENPTNNTRDLLVLPFGRVSQDIGNDLENTDVHDPNIGKIPDLINDPDWVPFVDSLEHELTTAIKVRVESIPSNGLDSRVGVLFSGGVDCITIAALLTAILPRSEPIELFNVAFENPRQLRLQANENAHNVSQHYDVPDRKTGRQGWEELCKIDPTREWRFVEVDVPYSQVLEYRSHIRQLLIPSNTVMDMSIGMAIWFASRGIGNLISNTQKQGEKQLRTEYVGCSRVLLLGMGADEQLGGYSRHRSAWGRGKWKALGQEIELDLSRIATRNLGRDDRIISDNAKEARFPFLAANVVRFLSNIPLGRKMDMRYPRGMGEKLLLRMLAYRLGLVQASTLAKKAIQFGARSAKMESNQSK